VGAGGAGGAREVLLAMQAWQGSGKSLEAWQAHFTERAAHGTEPVGIWPRAEHPAGFDPLGVATTTPAKQVLMRLATLDADSRCAWLAANLTAMEQAAGHPLSLLGVAAAAFADLDMLPDEGEMLCLLLRLPGAAAHALEQGRAGHKRFPFYELELEPAADGAA
jgi:citrate synthase